MCCTCVPSVIPVYLRLPVQPVAGWRVSIQAADLIGSSLGSVRGPNYEPEMRFVRVFVAGESSCVTSGKNQPAAITKRETQLGECGMNVLQLKHKRFCQKHFRPKEKEKHMEISPGCWNKRSSFVHFGMLAGLTRCNCSVDSFPPLHCLISTPEINSLWSAS